MTSAQVTAMRHPELDDEPVRDRYALEGKLGRGGMGVVVEAHDRRVDRRVAIKRLAGAATPVAVERFVREARVQGRLDHPSIAPVYDLAIQSDGRPYFAMRRLYGVTLADVLHRQATGDADALASWPRVRLLHAFVDVCLTVEYAHTRGVIHRDLKPANVVLGEFGEVYVLDWGVAYLAGADAEVGQGLPAEIADGDVGPGTAGYMAPEQCRGEPPDARADVWALGALLFEILAGTPLCRDVDPASVDAHPASRAPTREVPGELDAACARACAPMLDDRYASAREVATAVRRHLDADLDAVVRTELAASHAARALAALDAAGDGARAEAMREAGRALALDAHNVEAAAVARTLLLDAPAPPPAAVVQAIDAADRATLRRRAWASIAAYAAVPAFVPLLVLQGVRDWRIIALLPAIAAVLVALTLAAMRGDRWASVRTWAGAACGVVLMLTLSRILGPFVLLPAMAVLAAMIVTTHPTLRSWWLMAAMLAAAPLAVWLLEQAGLLQVTTRSVDGRLYVGSTAIYHPATPTMVGLYLYVGTILLLSSWYGHSVAQRHHHTRRALALQAWHLGRMLPDEDAR